VASDTLAVSVADKKSIPAVLGDVATTAAATSELIVDV
jgi:hypothetical protein